jgi:hypothetical protein
VRYYNFFKPARIVMTFWESKASLKWWWEKFDQLILLSFYRISGCLIFEVVEFEEVWMGLRIRVENLYNCNFEIGDSYGSWKYTLEYYSWELLKAVRVAANIHTREFARIEWPYSFHQLSWSFCYQEFVKSKEIQAFFHWWLYMWLAQSIFLLFWMKYSALKDGSVIERTSKEPPGIERTR